MELNSKRYSSPYITCHEGTEGEICSSTVSLTSALYGGGWSASRPDRFTHGKGTRFLIVQVAGRFDGFGGLVVSMLAFGNQVCGFKPDRSRWIFTGVKILSMPSSGGEVKESVPCPSFSACKRT